MNKWHIGYTKEFEPSPLSFWTHIEADGQPWYSAMSFVPPKPLPVPGKGFAVLKVPVLGVELRFASVAEVHHFLEIMRQKNLPTTRRLSGQRATGLGPNSHWLSRLPSGLKAWTKRAKVIAIVEQALPDFEKIENTPRR